MATFDYTDIQNIAYELIDDFGDDITLRVKASPNPSTPWEPNTSYTDYSGKGVRLTLNYKDNERMSKDSRGTAIESYEKAKFYIAGKDFTGTPKVNDIIIYKTLEWSIKFLEHLKPRDETMYFKIIAIR